MRNERDPQSTRLELLDAVADLRDKAAELGLRSACQYLDLARQEIGLAISSNPSGAGGEAARRPRVGARGDTN